MYGRNCTTYLYEYQLDIARVCKLLEDIRKVASQCLAIERMGMTPNTLIVFWFFGFKCKYVHDWDTYLMSMDEKQVPETK